MQQTMLLTGASGFLGGVIKDFYTDQFLISTVGRGEDTSHKFDIKQSIPVFDERFDIVIHAAGKAHGYSRYHNADEFYEINYQGTINLLTSLEKYPPASFVFISSVAVYGLNAGCNIDEHTPLEAVDPYGKSKILAENYIDDWCKKNKVKCTILRLPLVVGNNAPGNLGAMIKGIEKGLYFNIGGGRAQKSMVLAIDVAAIMLKASQAGGIFNLTDGAHPSFNQLSKHIANQLGKGRIQNLPLWFAKILSKIGDWMGKYAPLNTDRLLKLTATLTFDDTKAKAMIGWNPTPVLDGFKIIKSLR